AISTVELIQPDPLTASVNTTNLTCFNGANGIITVSNSAGGSNSFEYSIDGVTWVSNPVFENLSSGDYLVTIRDKQVLSCFRNLGNYTLNQPEVLSANYSYIDVSCSDKSNGSIKIEPNGGSGEYNFSIDGGNTWSENST